MIAPYPQTPTQNDQYSRLSRFISRLRHSPLGPRHQNLPRENPVVAHRL